jgi:prepilin peptidase CpaA
VTIAIALTLAATAVASLYDVHGRRIPNVLTALLAVAALIVHAVNGPYAALASLAVMVVVTLGGALIYSRGGIGGGDIKLAIAGCGMLSYPLCVAFLLYSAIGGGLLAVLYLVFRPESRPAMSRAILLAAGTVPVGGVKRLTVPYALAFAFGALAVALSQSVAPFLRIAL